jgi:hypothetical protein
VRLTEEESRYGEQRTAIEPREAQTEKRKTETRAADQQYRAQELESRPGDVLRGRPSPPGLPEKPPLSARAGWDLLSARSRGFVRVRAGKVAATQRRAEMCAG